MTSTKPWPPPPDLASIAELVRVADPEGHLADGAPADEYEPEEEAIFAAISHWPTANLNAPNLIPVLEQVWQNSFACDDAALARVSPALHTLAAQIERFFGPAAQTQTRQTRGSGA